MNNLKKSLCAVGFCLALPATSNADLITFNFTGELVVAGPAGGIITNSNGSPVTPIAASLTFDTSTGFGSSNLSLTMSTPFLGSYATFHDISITHPSGNLLTGQILVDWGSNLNMPLDIKWDATGLFNAINYGLNAGDVISGSTLYHDANANGVFDSGEFLTNVSSATPYSDTLQTQQGYNSLQGTAPMAATSASLGLTAGPLTGIRGYFDIGSGNSMHVVSVEAVPIPAAAWLFGSGLLGLIGMGRRKAA